jgi:hypothetical protein
MFVPWNESLSPPAAPSIRSGHTFDFAVLTADGRPLGAIAYVRSRSRPNSDLRVLLYEPSTIGLISAADGDAQGWSRA